MKEIFKTVVEPLISLPKWCFSIQTTLICVYHIILKEDDEKSLKAHLFTPYLYLLYVFGTHNKFSLIIT